MRISPLSQNGLWKSSKKNRQIPPTWTASTLNRKMFRKIKNLVSAIEQGIITSATKDRLDEMEQEKSDIEGRIAREEMKKPLLNENRIRYWLTLFKSGNVDDEDYQRRVIDTLVV